MGVSIRGELVATPYADQFEPAHLAGGREHEPEGDDGAYVNFLGPDDSARIEAAYPAPTLTRLRRFKTAYDPANVFRNNVNITPYRST